MMKKPLLIAVLCIFVFMPLWAQPLSFPFGTGEFTLRGDEEYEMLAITEEGLYYKNRLDITDWEEGEDYLYLSPYYIPWNGEDSIDYENVMGQLKINGKLVGIDLVEHDVTEIPDKDKIMTVQAEGDKLDLLAELPNCKAASVVGLDDANVDKLEECENLYALDLAYTKVDDDDLKYITSLKNLRALNLAYTNITDEGLAHLKELDNLRSLDLESTEITDDGVTYLKELEDLRSLNLFRTKTSVTDLRGRPLKVSDEGLEALASIPNLTELNLHGSAITDKGIESIVSMSNVKRLDLSATGITDNCIEHLSRMKHLRNLNIKGTGISADGIKKLKTELPKCYIKY
ncbi:hypothetical protein GF359_09825 [candidate division WOR-3 bacterium]|uniref:Leucine-rich repeat domain-containing protein n=1 Tax=candidate division WOR-3 bacterium TaxID=2052148 RepID=A0A9D5KAW0_UNCW3|nr:hypothetical protein [candidate division WOR-3 bacterium]MBD3365498.1 hypothetical protein [candidate division WOR-3 bacterium]